MAQQFRAGVVAVVRHPTDPLVMAFERADLPGEWQFPQGGIDEGEEPGDAAWRELGEETGLGPADVELHAELPGWYVYEWPPELRGKRRGQAQRWYLFAARSAAVTPVVDGHELRAWQWCDPGWIVERVVGFRRDAYAAALAALAPHLTPHVASDVAPDVAPH